MEALTAADAREIFYALGSKKHMIEQGLYDERDNPDDAAENARWIAHIDSVIGKIGVDGKLLHQAMREGEPMKATFKTRIPELDETTNEIDPTKRAHSVVIRNIGDGLTIDVPGTMFLTLERIGGKTQLFVGGEDGVDEVCVVKSEWTAGETPRVKVYDVGGYLLTDSEHFHQNCGPVTWEPAKGPPQELHNIAEPHLISILCMLTRIARFFGGRRWMRLMPMCYKSLAEEAERRGSESSRWLNAPASQPNWTGGIERDLRHQYYIKAVVTGDTPAAVYERLGEVGVLIADRVAKHETDTIRFTGIYPAIDEPEVPSQSRERVVQISGP